MVDGLWPLDCYYYYSVLIVVGCRHGVMSLDAPCLCRPVWAVGSGPWALCHVGRCGAVGCGLWAVGSGPWALCLVGRRGVAGASRCMYVQ